MKNEKNEIKHVSPVKILNTFDIVNTAKTGAGSNVVDRVQYFCC